MAKQQFPEPIVGAVIFNPQGEIFLLKSHKWKDKYVIPGGHIEFGESFEEALKREMLEETGFKIYNIKFFCLHEFIFNKAFWQKKHFVFLNFTCQTRSRKVKLNEEAQGFTWATPKEALKLPLEPFTRDTIKKYLKRRV